MGLLSKLFQSLSGKPEKINDTSNTVHTTGGREPETGDNSNCNGSAKVVEERIEKVLARYYPDYQYTKHVPITYFASGLSNIRSKKDVYYIIKDSAGREVAVILLLSSGMYRTQWLKDWYDAFRQHDLKHVHFMLHLPNRMIHIEARLREMLG